MTCAQAVHSMSTSFDVKTLVALEPYSSTQICLRMVERGWQICLPDRCV